VSGPSLALYPVSAKGTSFVLPPALALALLPSRGYAASPVQTPSSCATLARSLSLSFLSLQTSGSSTACFLRRGRLGRVCVWVLSIDTHRRSADLSRHQDDGECPCLNPPFLDRIARRTPIGFFALSPPPVVAALQHCSSRTPRSPRASYDARAHVMYYRERGRRIHPRAPHVL